MEHGVTWYYLLPHGLQALLPEHTFFALIAALIVIVFALTARSALARAADPTIPDEKLGARNIVELLLEYVIVRQSDAIIGQAGRKYVPYFASFFFFILFSNLMVLLPGFASPTGNLNTTLGLALVSFVGYNVIGVREQGMAYFKQFIGPMTYLPGKGFLSKLAFVPVLLISVIFFLILELFSNAFRPVSLSLRLFGNIMGDHEVIGAFTGLTKLVIPVAFYVMGALVSVIQAFVFMVLSMIYVALAVVGHGHEEEHGHEAPAVTSLSDRPLGEDEERGVVGQMRWKGGKEMRKLFAFLGGLFVSLISSGVALAAVESAAAGDSQMKAAVGIAAGLAVAVAAFGAGLGQGRVGAAAMESIGRNPNAADKLFLPLVLTLALLEALALYGFVIAIILSGKI